MKRKFTEAKKARRGPNKTAGYPHTLPKEDRKALRYHMADLASGNLNDALKK